MPKPGPDTVICGIIKHLGGDYVLVKCVDGMDRKARIPGKLRKRVWIREGDIVLVGPWAPNSDKGDIVYKYERDEVDKLIEGGYLTKEFVDALAEYI